MSPRADHAAATPIVSTISSRVAARVERVTDVVGDAAVAVDRDRDGEHHQLLDPWRLAGAWRRLQDIESVSTAAAGWRCGCDTCGLGR
jgi:hypothetical protein